MGGERGGLLVAAGDADANAAKMRDRTSLDAQDRFDIALAASSFMDQVLRSNLLNDDGLVVQCPVLNIRFVL